MFLCYNLFTTEICQLVRNRRRRLPALAFLTRPTLNIKKTKSEEFLPQEMYNLIVRCWNEDASERPDFVFIKSALDQISG